MPAPANPRPPTPRLLLWTADSQAPALPDLAGVTVIPVQAAGDLPDQAPEAALVAAADAETLGERLAALAAAGTDGPAVLVLAADAAQEAVARAAGIDYVLPPTLPTATLAAMLRDRLHAGPDHPELAEGLRQGRKMESVRLLAAGLAHDLNNILGGMVGYISLLRAKTNPDSDIHPMLDMIDRASDRATDVVSQLLTFSRRRDLNFEEIDLNAEISRALPMLRNSLPGPVRLHTELARQLPPVQADASLISLLVNNLCMAAANSLPAGGRLELSTAPEPEGVRLHLKVRGPDATATVLLSRPLPTQVTEGAGLGLAIVRDIVQDCRGRLEITHSGAERTDYHILLPGVAAAAPDRQPAPGGQPLVLVVDDEDIILKMIADCFDLLEYEGLFASTGEEGIALFEQHADRIRLVVLDLILPDVSGLEVLARMRATRPDLAVLVTSGFDYERGQLERQYQVNAFLNKPFKLNDLRQKLDELTQVR